MILKHIGDTISGAFKKDKNNEDPYRIQERKQKRDEKKVTKISLRYDALDDCYIWEEWTKEKMKDVPKEAVHVTDRRRAYLETDLWPELTWPKGGQSAIHMYIWMINEKLDPDRITEKRKPGADIDWKKLLMYGGLAVVIIIIASQFI